jgi:antitoxin (DNA-binding transcriptional repressor) of toxin-antitoxin stability system
MKTVTPLDLRRSLGRILDEASAGERFLIARDHHPLAVLVSVEDAARLDDPDEEVRKRRQAAFAALEEFRKSIRPDPSRMSSVEFIRRDRDAEVHGHWGELADDDE